MDVTATLLGPIMGHAKGVETRVLVRVCDFVTLVEEITVRWIFVRILQNRRGVELMPHPVWREHAGGG